MTLLSLIWVLNSSDSFTPTINPSLQRDTPNQEFGSILKCRNWWMLTTLIHANHCLLSLFITWRMYLFKRPQRALTICAASGESSFALFLSFIRDHSELVFTFFLCLTLQLLALLALSEKSIGNVYLLGQISGKQHVYHFKGCNPKAAPGPPIL